MSDSYISDPFLGEIRIFGGPFVPKGWTLCDGSLLRVSEYPRLYAILGTNFGGDGRVTFGVPDLSGCVPMHPGQTPGGTHHVFGERGGADDSTVFENQLPSHTHQLHATRVPADDRDPQGRALAEAIDWYSSDEPENLVAMAPACIGTTGGQQPHPNIQPSLVVRFIMALEGEYPQRPNEE